MGCLSPGSRESPLAQLRNHHRDHRRGRTADVDPAAATSRPGHREQRGGDRRCGRRDVGDVAASRRAPDKNPRHAVGNRGQCVRYRAVHRCRDGAGAARRIDDRPGGQDRVVDSSHPHRNRIDGSAHRLAARRDTRRRDGSLCARSRSAGAVVHDSPARAAQYQNGRSGHRYRRTRLQRSGIRGHSVHTRGIEDRHEPR